MKRAPVLALVAILAACTAAQGSSGDVTISTLARGSYASSRSGPTAILVTSESDYRARWSELIGQGEAPAADFANGVVVFLLAGQRNTGGWSVEPKSVAIEGDTAVIDAEIRGPAPDMIVTQALTYPYAVVSINSRGVNNVRWPR